ncbi:MAG: DEAD/DEAH box helicase family protein [Anaerolineae bacterium]|nr:DEAD/DEAH box helicase family protein [Anaerolineae bacterium]
MAGSTLERFERRLALVAYFRHVFGVEDVLDPDSVRRFYDSLEQLAEGYTPEGRSYVANVLQGLVRGISLEQLLDYDQNVRWHTQRLNAGRSEPIMFKYFQILAALMTEHYLCRATREPEEFLIDLNAFVERCNRDKRKRSDFPSFSLADLNKLAFWMATGSGKTLLMHINYYQYLHYRPNHFDNILLVTTGEGMSQQHMAELRKSGITCQHFSASSSDLFVADPGMVKVIEIHKLVEEKSGGGESIAVSSFEGRNLVLVDEGHKGASTEAQAWRSRREALAREGFTFEYSATFGQGIGGAGTEIEEEYGRAILFDYSYPRFYSDGYGKDYRILNLEQDLDPNLTSRYLLANLLTFYEQARTYTRDERTFFRDYNVARPLLIFVGHSVTAGKTRSQLSKPDKESLSDVQDLVLFLQEVLRNEGGWVPRAIDDILSGRAGLSREDDSDLFASAFRTLRQAGLDGQAIYKDLLQRIFHAGASGSLHLVDLKSAEGEIALWAGAGERFFGLINIGDAAHFLRLAAEKLPNLPVEEEQFSGSLFQEINSTKSGINILLGSKKFIEGWDSWRVSTMGLMNIGKGEGPQIIQLFGRGVRLLGQGRSLKRSSSLEGQHPENLTLLETLSIFGVRARYMAQFRDYLSQEGIHTGERETVFITTRRAADFHGKGLLVVRPRIRGSFQDAVRFPLALDPGIRPTLDLRPIVGKLTSQGSIAEQPEGLLPDQQHGLSPEGLSILDWERIYSQVWSFQAERDYHNLVIDRDTLLQVLDQGCYELLCQPELLRVSSFTDLARLQQIAIMLLRKYVQGFYTQAHRRWEHEQLADRLLDDQDENLLDHYEARVKRSSTQFLQTLREMLEGDDLYDRDDGSPPRVHFDRHLYLPLLAEDHADDPLVVYEPPGLNDGEVDLVRKLRDYAATESAQALLEASGCEIFLLRNQSRGHGVGFLVDGERFFPDFIMWLKGDDYQDIVFIDPHGLIMGGDLTVNPKVQFHRTIKDYQHKLNGDSGRKDVALHSYIISQTGFEKLSKQVGISPIEAFNGIHVYFRQQPDYAQTIVQEVLRSHR